VEEYHPESGWKKAGGGPDRINPLSRRPGPFVAVSHMPACEEKKKKGGRVETSLGRKKKQEVDSYLTSEKVGISVSEGKTTRGKTRRGGST